MLRICALAVVVLVALAFSRTTSAQEPQPTVPAPADDEIVFTGGVPVEPGTIVTLRPFSLVNAELGVCDEARSFAADGDSETSRFILVFEADCFQGADAAFICWDDGPPYRECSAVAFSPAAMEAYVQPERHDRVFSFERLGEVIDVGTLPIPSVEPDCILPPADVEPQHPAPPPPLPRPLLLDDVVAAPDTIVYGGWAPVPPGSTVTLTTYETTQAVLEFEDCTETITSAGAAIRGDVSEFLLVMPDTCLYENTGAVVCWAPGLSTEFCSMRSVDRSSLGQTIDLGLLRGVPTRPSGTCVLPSVGTGTDAVQGFRVDSLTWLALVAFAFGLCMSSASLILSRRR